jgi:hypothetical protein
MKCIFIFELKTRKISTYQTLMIIIIIKALVNNYILHAVLNAYEYSTRTTFHDVCFKQFELNITGQKIIDLALEEKEKGEIMVSLMFRLFLDS